jgi:hypothetical protein
MLKESTLLLLGTAFLLWAPVAFADVVHDPAFFHNPGLSDPGLFEDGSGCITSGTFKWCVASTLKSDPLSGLTTVAYQFDPTVIPTVTAGDILVNEFGTSTVGDVIRFEAISGNNYAFVFSNDKTGGQAADVGLPSSFQANNVTITEDSTGMASLAPTSGQPGFEPNSDFNFYHLDSVDVNSVPEPVNVFLLGGILAVLVGGAIRRHRFE